MTDQQTIHQPEEDARNASILIHVNGRIVPRAEAMVSVYGSGFLMGDGVWKGLRLYNGRWAFSVAGEYELDAPAGETMVAVKITDMLDEEVLVTQAK